MTEEQQSVDKLTSLELQRLIKYEQENVNVKRLVK